MADLHPDSPYEKDRFADPSKKVEFPVDARKTFNWILTRYPTKEAALLPTLHLAQEVWGWISPEAVHYIGELLDLSPAQVFGVVSFYNMYNQKPVGKYHLQVCTNLSCMVSRAYDIYEHLCDRLKVNPGQTTTDGALGFVIAHLLAGQRHGPDAEFVQDVLQRHPPFPYTLWRFTSAEIELGGHTLPPNSPLLIHIAGINAHGGNVTFGAGPHFCVGAQLAHLELEAVVAVLRQDYPHARLALPLDELPLIHLGIQGRKLRALPVHLRPATTP